MPEAIAGVVLPPAWARLVCMLPRQRAACERATPACQRGQTLTKRRVQPFDVRRVDHAVALRPTPQRLNARGRAIQTMPPWRLTRISSACTWPRCRGGSSRGSWTAWPWRPVCALQAATVRSSNPKATTMACTGQPWASNVMLSATRSPAVRKR